MSLMLAITFISVTCNADKINDLSYDETVTLIAETMANSTSSERKESYGYIRFDRCSMDYNVMVLILSVIVII